MVKPALTIPPPVWAFGGSRQLSPVGGAFARAAATWLLSFSPLVAVGCSKGADSSLMQSALSQGLASRLRVRAVFGSFFGAGVTCAVAGAASTSNPHLVQRVMAAGARVATLAGGPLDLDLPTRLANRTRSVARAATAGGVIVCEHNWGIGSALLGRSLLARGLPVIALPVPGTLAEAPPFGSDWALAAPDGWLGGLVWLHPGNPGLLALAKTTKGAIVGAKGAVCMYPTPV